MNSYLLSFDQSTSTREEFVGAIDRIKFISNWLFFFENTACIISDMSAQDLADLIDEELPKAHFIIAKMERDSRGGWLRKSIWDFIKDPKPVSG